MTYIKIPNLIFIGSAILWMFVSCDAHAWPDKFSIFYGVDKGGNRSDGNGCQKGPNVFCSRDEKSATYAFEFSGATRWDWARWSFGYFSRGKKTTYGQFLPDEHYKRKDWYSRDPNQIRWATRVKGFTLTFDPQWRVTKKLTIYGQFGLSHYRSKTRYCYRLGEGNGERFHLTTCNKNGRLLKKDTGLTNFLAAGFDFKPKKHWSWGMRWYRTGRENDTWSPYKDHHGVHIGISRQI